MEIPCSWPLHIRSSTANELRLTHRTRSRTLLRRPSGGSYAPDYTIGMYVYMYCACAHAQCVHAYGIKEDLLTTMDCLLGIIDL